MGLGLSKSFLSGFFWMGSLRAAIRALSLVKMAVLARFLSPGQFGIYGIATVVLAFLETLTETGINVFLIQQKEKIEKYVNSAWVVSILRGTVISLIIIILAVPAASFFSVSGSVSILYLTSLIPFIRGFINPSCVVFQKNLEFKKQFFYESTFFVSDAVFAILIGIATKSENSLVIAMVITALLEVILSFKVFHLKPKFVIDKELIFEVIQKGKWITGAGVFSYLFHHIDDIFVGKLLGTYTLGVYQQAYRISSVPVSEVGEIFNKVNFPIIARQEQDLIKIRKMFFKNLILISFFVIPLGYIFFKFPSQVISIVLGSQWLAAIPILQILSIYGVLKAISNSFFSLFLGLNNQQFVTYITLLQAISMLALTYPLIKIFGSLGAGYAAIISTIISLPVFIYYAWKILK